MRRIPKLWLALFLFMFAVSLAPMRAESATSRPADAQGWSRLIHDRYQAINSMQAEFAQTITHQESGISEERQGELYFKKPFLVRWVSNPPYSETIVVNRDFLWQYFPDEQLALKFNASDIDDQSEFLSVLTGRAPLIEKFRILPRDEAEGVQALRLVPINASLSLVDATIWVDAESGLILRLLYSDFYGNVNDIAFTNQRLNLNINDAAFNLTLDKDTLVEDHTR